MQGTTNDYAMELYLKLLGYFLSITIYTFSQIQDTHDFEIYNTKLLFSGPQFLHLMTNILFYNTLKWLAE